MWKVFQKSIVRNIYEHGFINSAMQSLSLVMIKTKGSVYFGKPKVLAK